MVILFVSLLQGGLAWYTSHLGKHRLALFLLITLGLTLRVFVSTDYFLHDWDERYHALVAKHLLEHPLVFTLYDTPVLPYDYQNWAGNHIWLHKPPMTLWCIALVIASLWVLLAGCHQNARLSFICCTGIASYYGLCLVPTTTVLAKSQVSKCFATGDGLVIVVTRSVLFGTGQTIKDAFAGNSCLPGGKGPLRTIRSRCGSFQ